MAQPPGCQVLPPSPTAGDRARPGAGKPAFWVATLVATSLLALLALAFSLRSTYDVRVSVERLHVVVPKGAESATLLFDVGLEWPWWTPHRVQFNSVRCWLLAQDVEAVVEVLEIRYAGPTRAIFQAYVRAAPAGSASRAPECEIASAVDLFGVGLIVPRVVRWPLAKAAETPDVWIERAGPLAWTSPTSFRNASLQLEQAAVLRTHVPADSLPEALHNLLSSAHVSVDAGLAYVEGDDSSIRLTKSINASLAIESDGRGGHHVSLPFNVSGHVRPAALAATVAKMLIGRSHSHEGVPAMEDEGSIDRSVKLIAEDPQSLAAQLLGTAHVCGWRSRSASGIGSLLGKAQRWLGQKMARAPGNATAREEDWPSLDSGRRLVSAGETLQVAFHEEMFYDGLGPRREIETKVLALIGRDGLELSWSMDPDAASLTSNSATSARLEVSATDLAWRFFLTVQTGIVEVVSIDLAYSSPNIILKGLVLDPDSNNRLGEIDFVGSETAFSLDASGLLGATSLTANASGHWMEPHPPSGMLNLQTETYDEIDLLVEGTVAELDSKNGTFRVGVTASQKGSVQATVDANGTNANEELVIPFVEALNGHMETIFKISPFTIKYGGGKVALMADATDGQGNVLGGLHADANASSISASVTMDNHSTSEITQDIPCLQGSCSLKAATYDGHLNFHFESMLKPLIAHVSPHAEEPTINGPCTVSGSCVLSPNYPDDYGPDQECTIHMGSSSMVYSETFSTEWGFDVLEINGEKYHGSTGPYGVIPTADIVWSSDFSGGMQGWKVCSGKTAIPMYSSALELSVSHAEFKADASLGYRGKTVYGGTLELGATNGLRFATSMTAESESCFGMDFDLMGTDAGWTAGAEFDLESVAGIKGGGNVVFAAHEFGPTLDVGGDVQFDHGYDNAAFDVHCTMHSAEVTLSRDDDVFGHAAVKLIPKENGSSLALYVLSGPLEIAYSAELGMQSIGQRHLMTLDVFSDASRVVAFEASINFTSQPIHLLGNWTAACRLASDVMTEKDVHHGLNYPHNDMNGSHCGHAITDQPGSCAAHCHGMSPYFLHSNHSAVNFSDYSKTVWCCYCKSALEHGEPSSRWDTAGSTTSLTVNFAEAKASSSSVGKFSLNFTRRAEDVLSLVGTSSEGSIDCAGRMDDQDVVVAISKPDGLLDTFSTMNATVTVTGPNDAAISSFGYDGAKSIVFTSNMTKKHNHDSDGEQETNVYALTAQTNGEWVSMETSAGDEAEHLAHAPDYGFVYQYKNFSLGLVDGSMWAVDYDQSSHFVESTNLSLRAPRQVGEKIVFAIDSFSKRKRDPTGHWDVLENVHYSTTTVTERSITGGFAVGVPASQAEAFAHDAGVKRHLVEVIADLVGVKATAVRLRLSGAGGGSRRLSSSQQTPIQVDYAISAPEQQAPGAFHRDHATAQEVEAAVLGATDAVIQFEIQRKFKQEPLETEYAIQVVPHSTALTSAPVAVPLPAEEPDGSPRTVDDGMQTLGGGQQSGSDRNYSLWSTVAIIILSLVLAGCCAAGLVFSFLCPPKPKQRKSIRFQEYAEVQEIHESPRDDQA